MNFKEFGNRAINGGIQYLVVFPNGYGASIVKHPYSYGGKYGLWKLAVIGDVEGEIFKEDFTFSLKYDTGITEDVLEYISEDDVTDYLLKIKAL